MNFLHGITALLVYQLIGEVVVLALRLPIPGPVLGMLLLFVTLLIRGSAPDAVQSASTTLLSHLSLLFVPAGVGLIVYFDRILEEWLAIGLTLLASTLVTLGATALLVQWSENRLARRGERDD